MPKLDDLTPTDRCSGVAPLNSLNSLLLEASS